MLATLELLGAEPLQTDTVYTNIVNRRGPWSIHVVKIPRRGPFELRSVHAGGTAIGLGELSNQIKMLTEKGLDVVAAVNGDFYQRAGAHEGDPRGLQIINGELLSSPIGTASFWIDSAGEPHLANTSSDLRVRWPGGSYSPLSLNGDREPDEIALYTPSIGRSTRAERGREIILESEGTGGWLPLHTGAEITGRVKAVRNTANGEVAPGTMVLSLGPIAAREIPLVKPGEILRISTATKPDLRNVKTAISGGPILVKNGAAQRFGSGWWRAEESGSELRRHPRSAIGWNDQFYFLVTVDGRQRRSVGMNLAELADFLVNLGCTEAMNLDGGGSATLWYQGRLRNEPCDGYEREIANSLMVLRKQK